MKESAEFQEVPEIRESRWNKARKLEKKKVGKDAVFDQYELKVFKKSDLIKKTIQH